MKNVVIHTDGGCHGNPGPGGWAAFLKYGAHSRRLSGSAAATTNNRMELQAAIEALKALKEPCCVTFYTDSTYLRDGISSWLPRWKRNQWMTKNKRPVKNMDLWRQLDAATSPHTITWHWERGHAGNSHNELCDELAHAEIEKIKRSLSPSQLQAELEAFLATTPAAPEDSLF